VSAKDQSSGHEQAVKVTPSSGLSGDEIKRIIDEAKFRSDEDRKLKGERILKNRMSGLLQTTAKTFTEFGWLLPENDQSFVRDALKTAKNAQEGIDTNIDYTRLMQDLEQAASLLTHAMFSSQANSKDGKLPSPQEQTTCFPG
jgi:molecular chaperone DnaK